MNTIIREENNDLVAYFEGRLDTTAASQTAKDVTPLNDCIGHNIILDCTNLEYISSSGLRIFLNILKKAKPLGSHVYVRGLNDDLREVFKITGFTNLFEYSEA